MFTECIFGVPAYANASQARNTTASASYMPMMHADYIQLNAILISNCEATLGKSKVNTPDNYSETLTRSSQVELDLKTASMATCCNHMSCLHHCYR